jgi:hypothetical protein
MGSNSPPDTLRCSAVGSILGRLGEAFKGYMLAVTKLAYTIGGPAVYCMGCKANHRRRHKLSPPNALHGLGALEERE